MHVYMNACMFSPRAACLYAARCTCTHARPLSIIAPNRYLLSRGYISFMYVCILDAMYVCLRRALPICALSSRRGCWQARPPYIIEFTRYHRYIYFCVYLALGFYGSAVFCVLVPCLPVLVVLACSPALMNARSSVARCSIWFHPCLHGVKYLRESQRQNIFCSFSHTGVHACSTSVDMMCMLPSCSSCSCSLCVAAHPLTLNLCSSASASKCGEGPLF